MQPSIKVENQNMILESNRILSWLKKVHVVHIIRSLKQQKSFIVSMVECTYIIKGDMILNQVSWMINGK